MNKLLVFITLLALSFVLAVSACSTTQGATTITAPPPTATLPAGEEPVAVVSVSGPYPVYIDGKPLWNPGGPVVEITLKNVSAEPVASLTADFGIDRAGQPGLSSFFFIFDVTSAAPLLPGSDISVRQTLIGGGFSDNISYPLTINGTLQSGAGFTYTKQVLITVPAQ